MLNNKKESKGTLNACAFFMENFVSTLDKDVYLVLKWLITVHRLIKMTSNPYLVEVICQNIGLVKEIPFAEKYEEYLHDKLVKPYLQYLKKLTMLKIRKIQTGKQKEHDK